MSEIPPLQQDGQPDLPIDPPLEAPAEPVRNWVGWILTGVVAFALFSLQTAQYLHQEKNERSFAAQESSLKTVEVQGRLMKMLYAKALSDPKQKEDVSKKAPAQQKTAYQQILDAVKSDISTNEQAATLAVAASIKLGVESPGAAVKTLQKSFNPRLRALVTDPKDVSRLQNATLWNTLEKGSYSQKILAAHVLSQTEGGEKANDMVLPDSDVTATAVALMAAFCVLGLGTIFLALGVILHFTGYWKSKRLPVDIETADKYAVWMGVFLCMLVVVPIIVIGIIQGSGIKLDPGLRTLIPFAALTLVFIISLTLPLQGIRVSLKGILGNWKPWPRQIMVGLGAYAANFPMILVLAMIVMAATAPFKDVLPQPSHPINEVMSSGGQFSMFFAGMAAVLLAPILEELAFRGIFFPALARALSPLAACLIQGFIFASIHPQGLPAIPMLMVIGVTGSIIAWKEGSLLPSMVMHAAHNFTILMLGMSLI